MAVRTKIDKCGFQARLNTSDSTFVDIIFHLNPGTVFYIQIVEALAIDQSDSQLFWLSCIDKHSFHVGDKP